MPSRRWSIAISLLILAACGGARPIARPSATEERSPHRVTGAGVRRIAVVVMENREYGRVIGDADAPFVNRLAGKYGLATKLFAVRHPSLPNYLALLGGSTFGIASDCTSCHVAGVSLVDQLERAGISWRAYMEGMPSACFAGAFHGRYAKKHDPFLYFDRIRERPKRCRNVVPYRRLGRDIANRRLPRFVWVTPDLCHDGHDCSTRTADRWLHRHVPRLLTALGKHGVLFLTWDEGGTDAGCCSVAHGGHVATIVAGGMAKRGIRDRARLDGYSILRTIEDLWGLAPLRHAGCACTRSMTSTVR